MKNNDEMRNRHIELQTNESGYGIVGDKYHYRSWPIGVRYMYGTITVRYYSDGA